MTQQIILAPYILVAAFCAGLMAGSLREPLPSFWWAIPFAVLFCFALFGGIMFGLMWRDAL